MPQEFARIIAEPFVRTLFATQIFIPCPLHTQDQPLLQPAEQVRILAARPKASLAGRSICNSSIGVACQPSLLAQQLHVGPELSSQAEVRILD